MEFLIHALAGLWKLLNNGIVHAFTYVISLGLILWTVTRKPKPKIALSSSQKNLEDDNGDSFRNMQIQDDRNMQNLIVRHRCKANRQHMHAAEPYILFDFELTNASVFALTCVRIEGRVEFGGQPLQHGPQLVTENQVIRHGEFCHVCFRQYLNSESSARIMENLLALTLGRTALWFEYDFLGERKTMRYAGPNAFDGS